MILSEESGIGESQKAYLIPVFFARFFTSFKNDRQVFNATL